MTSTKARCPGSNATSGFRQAYPNTPGPEQGIDWRVLYMCPFCTARRRPLQGSGKFPVHAPRQGA